MKTRGGLPFGLGAGQLLEETIAVMHHQSEIGAACALRDDVEKDAAMAGDHFDFGAVGLRKRRLIVAEVTKLEIVVAWDHPVRQPQWRQRFGDRAVLLRRRMVGVVAGQEHEVGSGADVRVDLGDDRGKPVAALPAIGLVHMQVADMDPADRWNHGLSSVRSLAVPAQAGRSVPPKPSQSATLTIAKLPRM